MMKKDNFSTYHPLINFTYFAVVILCAMFMMNPVFLGMSCVGGGLYYIYLKGKKALGTAVYFILPVFCVSAFVNPLFSHQGVTILFYLKTGNPVTLESILYGMASGLLLAAVINWFSCYQAVMTSDKFIYLFGKIIPAMSLVLSMILRFVPKFQNQIKKVSDAQKCIGRDVSNGTVQERAKHGMKILSVMTTWALENSVDTADSMRSRGYGLRGRTNFSIYRFDSRDRVLMAVIFVLAGGVSAGVLTRQTAFFYYPALQMAPLSCTAVISYGCYGLLCLLPFLLNVWEELKWHYLKSKI